MSKQVITLSDRAAERVKEIISNAKDTIVGVRVGVAIWRMCWHVLCYGICKKSQSKR